MPTSVRRPVLARIADVMRAIRGEQSRAVISTTYPNGTNQSVYVRTANPQEYKPDGATIRVQGFNKHPVVHACIRVIADVVASVPLVVLKEKGNTETRVDPSHPLQQLLDYPGSRMTARSMRARFAVDFLGYGNAMFKIDRRGLDGPPIGLRSLNPEAVQSVWVDREGDAARYDVSNWSGIVENFRAIDVLHFRDLEMPRPFTADVFGFPRGASAIQSLVADTEATAYVRQVVTNDGTPTFAVLLSDEATVDDAAAMQSRYTERVVSRGKRGTPAFFGAVKDIKQLGFTLADLEFPDLRRVSREDICAAFGVDPRMIGIASATNDSGLSGVQYAEARARLVQHTIEPMLSAFEDEINHWLAPEFGDVWIAYDANVLRDLVENDAETSTRVRGEFTTGLRTWEESRAALKLPPVPEPTDSVLLTAGVTLTPAAVAVIDPTKMMDPAQDPLQGTPTTDAVPVDGGNAQQIQTTEATVLNGAQVSAAQAIVLSVAKGELPRDAGVAMLQTFFNLTPDVAEKVMGSAGLGTMTTPNKPEGGEAAPVAPMTNGTAAPAVEAEDEDEGEDKGEDEGEDEQGRMDPVATPTPLADDPIVDTRRIAYNRAMAVLDREEILYRNTALRLFKTQGKETVEDIAGLGRSMRSVRVDGVYAEAIRRAKANYKPGGKYHRQWAEAYRELIGATFVEGAAQSAVGLSFTLQSPQVLDAIERRTYQLATYVGDTTARQIEAAVTAAEKAGMSIAETARLVQVSVYGEAVTDSRATTIARTESAQAMSQGSWDQAQADGVYKRKEWLAFEDKDTRLTHSECMGEGPIPIDDAFAANGLQYPLDPAGPADEVINCRCTLVYYED